MRFAEAMEKRLRENEHKGSWEGYTRENTYEKVLSNLEDGNLYAWDYDGPDSFASVSIVRGEMWKPEHWPLKLVGLVDAANYLMMLFDNEVSKDAI